MFAFTACVNSWSCISDRRAVQLSSAQTLDRFGRLGVMADDPVYQKSIPVQYLYFIIMPFFSPPVYWQKRATYKFTAATISYSGVSLPPSLSLFHTQTHARTHARTQTHTPPTHGSHVGCRTAKTCRSRFTSVPVLPCNSSLHA